MNYGMKGKVALVTGGSLGLGKGICEKFLMSEATVIFTGRNAVNGEKTEKELSRMGTIEYVKSDISDENAVKDLIAYIAEKYGRLDYVVNNAAGFNPSMPLHQVDSKDFNHVLNVDVMGTFYCMKYAIEQMLTQETKGNIVNISSCTALSERKGLSPYIAAKHAVNGMTRVAALDYARDGIRINAVCPGMIQTPSMLETKRNDPAAYERYTNNIPTGHIATPDEIASTVVFLCSDEAKSTTGVLYAVDNASSI